MELINHYCHGYVAVAIILNLEKRSVFTYLEQDPSSLEELCEHFHANSGSLKVAFNVLLSLGWLEQDAKKKYSLTILFDNKDKVTNISKTGELFAK